MLYANHALATVVTKAHTQKKKKPEQKNPNASQTKKIIGLFFHSPVYPGLSAALSSSSASFRPSSFPRSTSTAAISGIGSASSTAKNQNATLISPYLSVSAPTIVGPKMLEPLSVTAYRA